MSVRMAAVHELKFLYILYSWQYQTDANIRQSYCKCKAINIKLLIVNMVPGLYCREMTGNNFNQKHRNLVAEYILSSFGW